MTILCADVSIYVRLVNALDSYCWPRLTVRVPKDAKLSVLGGSSEKGGAYRKFSASKPLPPLVEIPKDPDPGLD